MKSKINTLFETIEYRYEPVHLKLDLTDFLQNMSSVLANIPVDLHKKDKSKTSDATKLDENNSFQSSSGVNKTVFNFNTQYPPNEIKFGIVFDYNIKWGKTQFYINQITDYEENIKQNDPKLNSYSFNYQNRKLIPIDNTVLTMNELINNPNKPKFNQINVSYSPNKGTITLHFFKQSLDGIFLGTNRINKAPDRMTNSRTGTEIDSKQLPPNNDDVILPLFNETSRVDNLHNKSDDGPTAQVINFFRNNPDEAKDLINKHKVESYIFGNEDL